MILDEDFCVFLEYRLTRAFNYSNDERLKYFWCDGVLLPDSEEEYSKKWVNDRRQVLMCASDVELLYLSFSPKYNRRICF